MLAWWAMACQTGEPICQPEGAELAMALEAIVDGRADGCQTDAYVRMLDERQERQGPWLQDVWVAPSADGATFERSQARLLIDGAAVPEIVDGPDGRLFLYSVLGDLARGRREASAGSPWFQTHGLVGWGALQLHVSDDGETWREEPAFRVDGLMRGMVVDPEVVQQPDGTWRLYYVGIQLKRLLIPETHEGGGEPRVFAAESRDLVHWRQLGEVANGPSADPVIHCGPGQRCLMVSSGLQWWTSNDGGQRFRPGDGPALEGFAPELVSLPDGRLRLLYNTKELGGPLHARISSDGGATWQDEGQVLPPRQAEAVSVLARSTGDHRIFFHDWKAGYSGDAAPGPGPSGGDQAVSPNLPRRSLPASGPRERTPESP